jgi:hypothetical protein
VAAVLTPIGESIELVLRCDDCGALSSDDVRGASGWTLRRRGALRLLDICPCCSPKKVARAAKAQL